MQRGQTTPQTKETPMAQYYHQIGNIVRLAKGWTPMTVIGLTLDNEVIAQYGTNPDRKDLRHPERALSTYTRPHHGFVQWDGKLMKDPAMKKRYQVIGSPMIGSFMQLTSQGMIALEFDDGTISAFPKKELVEVVPKTFAVKAIGGNNYKTQYIHPEGVEIKKGELLLSNFGNLYTVTEINTCSQTARVFEGQRVVLATL
jgi:hypothetical protein